MMTTDGAFWIGCPPHDIEVVRFGARPSALVPTRPSAHHGSITQAAKEGAEAELKRKRKKARNKPDCPRPRHFRSIIPYREGRRRQ
jgi:hypothetical protein